MFHGSLSFLALAIALRFGTRNVAAFVSQQQPLPSYSVMTSSPRTLSSSSSPSSSSSSQLSMAPPGSSTLKPAAIPLMDSGKALARSGELIIDVTSALELYGGSLSAAGAQIRNSGDCLAQAAASCRFKTAQELVCDELREGATCLTEATDKLKLGVEEAMADEDEELAKTIGTMVANLGLAGKTLEAAGESLMKGRPLSEIGDNLKSCGNELQSFAVKIANLAPGNDDATLSSQRMNYAAEKMVEAGNALSGVPKAKPKGKGWLKG